MLTLYGVTLSIYLWAIGFGLLGYFLGAIPTGLLIGKIFYKKDIRTEGSGNIGATNAIRHLGPLPGSLVLLIDGAKAFILPFYLIKTLPWGREAHIIQAKGFWNIVQEMVQSMVSSIETFQISAILLGVVAVFIFLGNCFNIFLKFKGGKGVATSFGIFLALSPYAAFAAALIYLLIFLSTKISAVGSLVGLLSLPLFIYLSHLWKPTDLWTIHFFISIFFYIIIFWKHRENIRKMI